MTDGHVLGGRTVPESSQVRLRVAGRPEYEGTLTQAQGLLSDLGLGFLLGLVRIDKHPNSPQHQRTAWQAQRSKVVKIQRRGRQKYSIRAHTCLGHQLLVPCLSVEHGGLECALPGQGHRRQRS